MENNFSYIKHLIQIRQCITLSINEFGKIGLDTTRLSNIEESLNLVINMMQVDKKIIKLTDELGDDANLLK